MKKLVFKYQAMAMGDVLKKLARRSLLVLLLISVTSLTISKQVDSKILRSNDTSITTSRSWLQSNPKENQIDDDRIHIAEPYANLLQMAIRFALAQTPISRHVNIDAAMEILTTAAIMLSKPSYLITFIEASAILIVFFLTLTFFYPPSYVYAETIWRNPQGSLNLDNFLHSGISEKSILDLITSKTNDMLDNIGIHEESRRQKTLCYFGEAFKCSLPKTSDALTKIGSNFFSSNGIKDNIFATAFVAGFVDQDCSKIRT